MGSEAAALYDVSGGVATITLNRPDNRNALSVELLNDVGDHFTAASADPGVRAIVFTNVGNTFCAGADLKSDRPGTRPPKARYDFVQLLDAAMTGPKPVLGRIAGHCTGGGVGFAAAPDISIAADDVVFAFTEVRLGVAPAVISVVCLPKLRRADASELFLSGERITAARAAEVGLVNRAVARENLDDAMDDVLDKVVRGGPNGLAAAKQLVARVPQMTRDEAWEWTSELSRSLFESDEAAAGIAAFRERRDPPWVPGAGD
ncbi:MAG TPA: enoyl-CoA hydratase [Acidimicrobiaceae bacterium]|nr:enoyl-CoA hydratase [Acidimicrobiaceae bacterium]